MQYFVSQSPPHHPGHVRPGRPLAGGPPGGGAVGGIDTAAITGGIGSLQRIRLHTITTTAVQPADKYWNFTGAIELGSVQGSVIGGEIHARVSAFDWDSKSTSSGISPAELLEEAARAADEPADDAVLAGF